MLDVPRIIKIAAHCSIIADFIIGNSAVIIAELSLYLKFCRVAVECFQCISAQIWLENPVWIDVGGNAGWKPSLVIILIIGPSEEKLFHIVFATDVICLFPGLVQCRKEHACENRDDRDYDKKLDQGENSYFRPAEQEQRTGNMEVRGNGKTME